MLQSYLAHRKRLHLSRRALSTEHLRQIAKDIGFDYFLNYDDQTKTKRREFKSAVDYFGINLDDKSVLDVGPGTSDSLDYVQLVGSNVKTSFIEYEPMFARFASLKGHHGVIGNYYNAPYFPKQFTGKFDLIYSKGSIDCTWVDLQRNRMTLTGIKSLLRRFDFDRWIEGLKAMLKSEQGRIILMPAMGFQPTAIVDSEYDLKTYHWCPDVDAYRHSFFVTTLVKHGFEVCDNIPGFTQKQSFPLAFHYSA